MPRQLTICDIALTREQAIEAAELFARYISTNASENVPLSWAFQVLQKTYEAVKFASDLEERGSGSRDG